MLQNKMLMLLLRFSDAFCTADLNQRPAALQNKLENKIFKSFQLCVY